MVPPAVTRGIAEASVVGLEIVPAAPAVPFGATYSVPAAGGGVVGLPVGRGVGLLVGLRVGPVGVGVPPPPAPVVTRTSSKPADAYAVCSPIRPPAATELVPE